MFVENFEDDLPVRSTRSRESKAAALANLHREIDAMLDSSSSGEYSESEEREE
ncbi:6471_t:CDS:2 [Paraglomus occultum]|uniref:6471_t:CDS:1 n=1 Tax=Paraglomus occultum TaxID=144539 RepID=A0A9N9ECQ5_9GLOM|nr:6471_t:CDS:2 [Paraglomus occultum]